MGGSPRVTLAFALHSDAEAACSRHHPYQDIALCRDLRLSCAVCHVKDPEPLFWGIAFSVKRQE